MKSSPQHDSLHVLFVDDEEQLQEVMREEIPRMGHRVTVCPNGLSAVTVAGEQMFDCAIVDLDMPGINGVETIQRIKAISPETETVMLTGKGTLESAVELLKIGAFDYMKKPCKLREINALLIRVAEKRALVKKCNRLQRQLDAKDSSARSLVGQHQSMKDLIGMIDRIAPTSSTVLVLGQTGTGKELVARRIHDQSNRQNHPFVAVNCGALPENLIESELFGHIKGAFTGAEKDRLGLFEVASGGTLFLDEIGELPKSLQAKLLRVLESGEIRRVGETESKKVDCRIVCATHRDLPGMVAEGEFREDLMYRINTFQLHVPSLSERTSDIPALALAFVERFKPNCPKGKNLANKISSDVIDQFLKYTWPGNVRELANIMEHACVMCDELPIELNHLPQHFGQESGNSKIKIDSIPLTIKEMEAEMIDAAIRRHQGNKTAAANELGISSKTLYNKMLSTGKKAA